MIEYQIFHSYFVILMTINVTLSFIVMLAACLCCKKKVEKNELLGLEGMVKLKNPDEIIIVSAVGKSESQVDLNASTISNADSEKRASTAAHRSLPDIPIAEVNCDNGSELYETVADKRLINAENIRNKSPTPSLKKQISVSQHSSISQADDVSSPYSRVKNSPHDYAKVRSTEHPYAQLNAPSTSSAAAVSTANSSQISATSNDAINSRSSHHSGSSQNINDASSQVEIPAASAIAGMISASLDLPYMTPPISNQHFSGDSQDSSKGYTSISVREPLANILAQQPVKPTHRHAPLSRDVNDSHYATVSDDSDETYAAIEDHNNRNITNPTADIYTSGSETYAQIQPMQTNSIVVAVEINNSSGNHSQSNSANSSSTTQNSLDSSVTSTSTVIHHNRTSTSDHGIPIPPPVDTLRAQVHSRQASSSSNHSSSMGNLGSPKPSQKRQANSPLPPTPKSSSSLHATGNCIASGRSSVISVIETGSILESNDIMGSNSGLNNDISPQRKNKSLSPSKDIEGMYAKVMKKNKFSRNSPTSQNSSPVMTRKYNEIATSLGLKPLNAAAAEQIESQNINLSLDKARIRSNSYSAKDHGYETIPADNMRGNNTTTIGGIENRKSDCYANILQKERQQEVLPIHKPPSDADFELGYTSDKYYETITNTKHNKSNRNNNNNNNNKINKNNNNNNVDPGYETLNKHGKKSSDYDPNYEVLKGPKTSGLSDDGYAKVLEKKRYNVDEEDEEEDALDGYSKVKGDNAVAGYSVIGEKKKKNHNYASILETKSEALKQDTTSSDNISDHYARIAETRIPPKTLTDIPLTSTIPDDDLLTSHLIDLQPITSPSSINSSTMLNTSSTVSSINLTTTSTSSRQTTTSSSQYESLTGSETDPNYESVSYMNSSSRTENPYERLQTDTQLSSSSPITPDDGDDNDRSNSSLSSTTENQQTTARANGPIRLKKQTNTINNEQHSEAMVDDYFQV